MRIDLPGGYQLDDDPARIDLDVVAGYLTSEAYWGGWRDRRTIERQVGSAWRVVGLYAGEVMVGFARAISDGIAFGYLADVFVLADHRGRGRGTALVRELVEGCGAADFRWMLHTRDAHGLYERLGFSAPDARVMERPAPGRMAG